MKLGKKNTMEKGTFMAYACYCSGFCVCGTCTNCQTIPDSSGALVKNNVQYSGTGTTTKNTVYIVSY